MSDRQAMVIYEEKKHHCMIMIENGYADKQIKAALKLPLQSIRKLRSARNKKT